MKNFFRFLKLENIKGVIKNVFSRFPVSIGILLFTALLFLVMIH